MRRAILTGLAAVATAVMLTSCVSIPASGPVQVGRSDLTQAERFVQVTAFGPAAGATQEELVRGFLLAANSSLDDYSVAREFLSHEYASQWDPYYGVLIYEGTKPYRSDGVTSGTLSLSVTASVDANGKLLPVESGASTDLRFDFAQENGEWRISAAPSGIILDRTSFVGLWSDHRLNFLGPGDRLVPETRWYLSRVALATEIVGSLIQGPGERLGQVVHSGFPPGVKLTNTTVPVVDGRAKVDLTGEGLDSHVAQQEMLLQLQASLQGVPGVNQVELLIDGTPVKASPEAIPPPPGGGSRIAGMSDGHFGIISGQQVEPVTGVTDQIDALKPAAVSLSRSKTVAAVRASGGVSIITDGAVTLFDERSGLLDPGVDDDEWVWSYAASEPDVVRVGRADGSHQDLAAPWLANRDVRALRVSPGGSLAAALVNDGEKSAVIVAGVIRDADGTPTGFSAGADIEMSANGTAVDFDWVNATRFVALTQVGNAGKVTVGGPGIFSSERGSVPDATNVSGGGSEAQIRVLNSEGELVSPQGSGWQRTNSEIAVLAKRG